MSCVSDDRRQHSGRCFVSSKASTRNVTGIEYRGERRKKGEEMKRKKRERRGRERWVARVRMREHHDCLPAHIENKHTVGLFQFLLHKFCPFMCVCDVHKRSVRVSELLRNCMCKCAPALAPASCTHSCAYHLCSPHHLFHNISWFQNLFSLLVPFGQKLSMLSWRLFV